MPAHSARGAVLSPTEVGRRTYVTLSR
jgi:hypothetical protein